jgi:palmitoyltransferase
LLAEAVRSVDESSCSHWSTIFLPVKVPPLSDGWTWSKRSGWREHVMLHEDELTDEEEMSSDEEEVEQ